MKKLADIITEKLILNSSTNVKPKYTYFPKDYDDLAALIDELLEKRGPDANMNDIDVSAIDDMTGLFWGKDPHNIDISKWDVSNVEDMRLMFYKCENFNCDISNWDVRNVKIMQSMFCNCKKFDCDLNSWDVNDTVDIHYMFLGCKSLKKIPEWYHINKSIDECVVSEKLILNKSTKQEYHYHPKDKTELIKLLQKLIDERGENADLNDVDVSQVKSMSWLFHHVSPRIRKGMTTTIAKIDISGWDVSNVEDMCGMFDGCRRFNCDLSEWNVSKVKDMRRMFYGCEKFDCDLSQWNVSKYTAQNQMFIGCNSLVKFPEWHMQEVDEKLVLNKSTSTKAKQDYEHTYHYHPKNWVELRNLLKKLLDEYGKDADLNDIDVSKITDMSELFRELDPHNIDISEWDVSNVTDMRGMFYKCQHLDCDISDWNVSNVKNMYKMFAGCTSLKNIPDWATERAI